MKPLIQLWLGTSTRSWLRFPCPAETPTVHGTGTNPARVLLCGSGIAAGHGVLTHELGLPGQLARRLAVLTGRGVDIDIAVRADMTARDGTVELGALELSRFDAIILVFGVVEALALRSTQQWRDDAATLLDAARRNSPPDTEIIVVSVPMFSARTQFPKVFEGAVIRQAKLFNAITAELCAELPHTTVIHLDRAESFRTLDSTTHERWASLVAPLISEKLRRPTTWPGRQQASDETGRQQSLDDLDILDSAPSESFDLIASIARDLFDVPMAAITFIDRERQWMKSAIGFIGGVIPRKEAFCNITIEDSRHFVIADTLTDERFADNPHVTGPGGVRFYAGYPIESPDGHRLGALCVMDDAPRDFTDTDATLLRSLALQVQELLWAAAHRTS